MIRVLVANSRSLVGPALRDLIGMTIMGVLFGTAKAVP